MKRSCMLHNIIKYVVLIFLLGVALDMSGETKLFHLLLYVSILFSVIAFDLLKLGRGTYKESFDEEALKETIKANIEASDSTDNMDVLNRETLTGENALKDFIEKISSIRNELKMKNEELQALREVSEIITSTFDVNVIIEYVYKVFNKFTGCDRYLICFADREGNLTFRYEFGNVLLGEIGNVVDKDSVVTKCFEKKQTIIFSNIFINSRGIQGDKIAIPLNVSGEIVGVIFMESAEVGAFSSVNVGFVESLAVYVAIAVKNAELFNNIYEQKQEIEALYEESAAVNEELSTYVYELNTTKEELKVKNDELNEFYSEIQTGYLQTVMALSNSIEAKDAYTRGHCQRVMEISCEMGKILGLSDNEIQELRYVAILHDIGKIGIPMSILNKKEKLTNEEFNEIKKHPLIAYSILKDVEFIKNGMDGILQHHERYDGKGYPYGLKGSEISKLGRILCVADAFDAMTSDRPYRKAMSMEDAILEIERCKGTQFDPDIADLFIGLSRQMIRAN